MSTQNQSNENIPENVNTGNKEVESQEQINWKKFREDRENDRKLRQAAEKKAIEQEKEATALKAAVEALLAKPSRNQNNNDSDEFEDKTEDQIIQEKVDKILAAREIQSQEMQKQREIAEYPTKLQQTYNDFNEVCTTENLDYLEYHYPEIANAFKGVPDGYDKWSNVYKAVKKLIPNVNSAKDQKRAEKNLSKPQAMAVAGLTQSSETAPRQLDDERRKSNWQRMQKVMKGGKV